MLRIFYLFILGTLVLLSSVAYSLWAFLTKNPRSFEIGLKLILIGIGVYILFLPSTYSAIRRALHSKQTPKDIIWLFSIGFAWLLIIIGILR